VSNLYYEKVGHNSNWVQVGHNSNHSHLCSHLRSRSRSQSRFATSSYIASDLVSSRWDTIQIGSKWDTIQIILTYVLTCVLDPVLNPVLPHRVISLVIWCHPGGTQFKLDPSGTQFKLGPSGTQFKSFSLMFSLAFSIPFCHIELYR
jgi:hypothetical protein